MNQDYNFSSKVKIFSLSLVVIGLMGIAYGFYSAPSTVEEAKEIVANMSHGSDHGGI
jgi:CheY-specific phosphatase CheX